MSPFEVLYGVKIKGAGITQAPLLFDPVEGDVSVQARVKELENLGRTREAVVLSTEAAKRQMARYYDWNVERDQLNIGEYVLLANKNQTKVLPVTIGPFRVLERRLFPHVLVGRAGWDGAEDPRTSRPGAACPGRRRAQELLVPPH